MSPDNSNAPVAAPPLNADQQRVAERLLEFLFNDQREIIINGPGGVGKTHLIGHLVETLYPQYLRTSALLGDKQALVGVALTATTNKAVEQLAQATGEEAYTIHSLLGLTVRRNFSTGKEELSRSRNWSVKQNLIIVIDEAGMICRRLLSHIRESVLNCKIIFVSDHCQLGPVEERLSPIFSQHIPIHELTIPVRNAGQPELVRVCKELRAMVEADALGTIQPVPGVIDVLDGVAMETTLAQYFQPGDYSARILAYTNRRVVDYNQYIRELRQQDPMVFGKDELLINNEVVRFGDNRMLGANETVRILRYKGIQRKALQLPYHPEKELAWDYRVYVVYNAHLGEGMVRVPTDPEYFQQILRYLAQHRDWKHYFLMKETYADLRDYSASTVHKAQGSTFTTVFIDLLDFQRCRGRSALLQLLYTAFTRPSNRIFLYGDLSERQGRLLAA